MSYITFENVSKSFRKETVLDNVSFNLEKGKIYGFIGRNGSGKTVIFKLISSLLIPSSGKISFNGQNLTDTKKFIPSIGVLIETPGFVPHYSGLKNLKILNDLSNVRVNTAQIKKSMEFVGLDPNNKKPVRTYSLGMTQKLGIAQAIMNTPDLLILDEPMNGLDDEGVLKMRKFFASLRDEKNVTILLASHNKEDIEILCDDLFLVSNGKVSRKVDEIS